jgi:hypothetical protein
MPNIDDIETNSGIDANNLFISLEASSSRTAVTLEELIARALQTGISKDALREYLLKDLNEGGRIFGEFLNAIKATTDSSIRDFSDSGQWAEDDSYEVKKWMWIAVLINTCPDCLERHGQIKTMEEWESVGIPRAGFTVCRKHCQCDLADADIAILKPKPIYRSSRRRK